MQMHWRRPASWRFRRITACADVPDPQNEEIQNDGVRLAAHEEPQNVLDRVQGLRVRKPPSRNQPREDTGSPGLRIMRGHVPNAFRRRRLVVDWFGALNGTVLAPSCDLDDSIRYLRYGSRLEILDSPLLADTHEPIPPVSTQYIRRQTPQHLRSVRLQRPDCPSTLWRRHRTPVDIVRHSTANGVDRVRPVVHEDRIKLIGPRPAFTGGFPAP